jgi:hypothetical protein
VDEEDAMEEVERGDEKKIIGAGGGFREQAF